MSRADTHVGATWRLDASEPYDRSRLERGLPLAIAAIEARLRAQGLVATKAPPIPKSGLQDGFIHNEHYRVLVQYDLFPIVGVHDEPDDDGQPLYIYGESCWTVRVDTLACDEWEMIYRASQLACRQANRTYAEKFR